MNATTGVRHAYRRGDEVVVTLENVRAHNIERGVEVAPECLPEWTIGVVIERRRVDRVAAYVLRIDHDGCVCACVVDEGAIEGLA